MKPKSFLSQTRALITLGVSASLLMANPGTASATSTPTGHERKKKSKEEPSKSSNTKTFASSRNNDIVKIYPDAFKRDMHVVVKEKEGREIDFYVFDVNGTIIKHSRMKEKEHIRVTGLARGKYIYRVFLGDEETANGHFEIR